MTESLKIVIDSKDALNASQNLDKLTKSSNTTELATSRLTKVTSALNIQNIVIGATVAKLATESIKLADTYNNMQSRLNLVTKDTKELTKVQEELYKSSQRTRTSYEESVELYSRIARSTEPLKLSNDRLLAITETINKTGIISGGSAESIKAALIQLGQGFASGTLRGEELNSVLEQTPRLAQAIADGMGVQVGALRSLAEQGKITSEVVIKALESQKDAVDKEFGQMTKTVSQSMTQMNNSILEFVGKVDDATQISTSISNFITDISDAITGATDSISGSGKDIAQFYIEAKAYLGSFADGINYVYEVIENSGQGIVFGLASAVNGALEVLLKMALETTKILNMAGLSSNDTLAKTQSAYNQVLQWRKTANKGLSDSIKEVNEAEKKASVSIQDRIKIGEAELRLLQQTQKLNDKQKSKAKDKDLKTAEQIKKEKEAQDKAKKEAEKQQKRNEEIANEKLRLNAEISVLQTDDQLKPFKALEEAYKLDLDKWKDNKEIQAKLTEKYNLERKELEIKAFDDYSNLKSKEAEKLLDDEIELQEKILEEKEKSDNKKLEIGKTKFDTISMDVDSSNISQLETKLVDLSDTYLEQLNSIEDKNGEAAQKLSVDYLSSVKTITDEMEKIRDFDFTIKLQGFDDISNGIAGIVNGFTDINTLQEDYNKNMQKAQGDTKLQDNLTQKYASDTMGAYSNMIGAIGNFYDEDDDRRKKQAEVMKVMNAAQMAMQLSQMAQSTAFTSLFVSQEAVKAQAAGVTAVAVAAQSSPWTGFATAAAMAAMLASFGIMLSGSGGGGSAPSAFEVEQTNIENTYNPMIEKLDRQIELLESIDKNGSAASFSVIKAGVDFQKDYKLFVSEAVNDMWASMKSGWGDWSPRSNTEQQIEELLGFNLGTVSRVIYDSYVEYYTDIVDGAEVLKARLVETYKDGITYLDTAALKTGYNFVKLLDVMNTEGNAIVNSGWNDMMSKGWNASGGAGTPGKEAQAKLDEFTSQFQQLLSDYTASLVESIDTLKDARDDFKGYYDDITGTDYFKNKDLEDAQKDIAKLIGSNNLADYLKTTVEQISALEEFLTTETIELLMSQDKTKLSEQLALVQRLEEETGQTFENGAKDALNYLESIELVSEALTTSTENIKDYLDSFKDEQTLATELASRLGVSLATTSEGLQLLFDNLSGGMEGLSDKELELLQANKALIESERELAETRINSIKDYIGGLYSDDENLDRLSKQFGVNVATSVDELAAMFERLAYDADGLTAEETKLLDLNKAKLANTEALQTEVDSLNETLSKTSESISSMESVFESLQDTIKELRVSGQEPSETLSDFMNSIVEAKDLLAKDDYEAYADKVSDIVGNVSILDDASLFTSKYDMEFAKARTAIELESLEDLTMDEVDYLKQIEENTRAQVDVLVQSMNNLGQSINSSLASKVTSSPSYSSNTTPAPVVKVVSQAEKTLNDAYQTLFGRDADAEGIAYWTPEIQSGAINSSNIYSALTAGAKAYAESGTGIYDKSKAQQEYERAIALKPILGFATGGYTGNLPTNAMAGIVHGQEYVVNAQTTRDLGLNNNSNVFSELLQEVKVLRQDNQAMKGLMTKLTADNHKMLTVERALYTSSVA